MAAAEFSGRRSSGSRLRLGPGDCFGEIASIRQIPRTATVIATEPGRLFQLEQADFVSAVTGHRVAERVALQLADERQRDREAPPDVA